MKLNLKDLFEDLDKEIALYTEKAQFYKEQQQSVTAREMKFVVELLTEIRAKISGLEVKRNE